MINVLCKKQNPLKKETIIKKKDDWNLKEICFVLINNSCINDGF